MNIVFCSDYFEMPYIHIIIKIHDPNHYYYKKKSFE